MVLGIGKKIVKYLDVIDNKKTWALLVRLTARTFYSQAIGREH